MRPVLFAAICVLAIVAGYFLQYEVFPDGIMPASEQAASAQVAEVSPITSVRINEIMTSNQSALRDGSGGYPDWIEITNVGDAPIDISGWILVDRTKNKNRFVFPEQVIGPGEFIVVFASNRLANLPGEEYHAPFKLSRGGDTLLLYDRNESVVESVNIPALDPDQSYARAYDSGEWMRTYEYTPGAPNTPENHAAAIDRTPAYQATVYINELMASNKTTLKDGDGEFSDWIELYNSGGEAVNLAGWSITDDPNDLDQWLFPEISIQPGEYLVIFASGKESADGELHAGFKLASEGERVMLLDRDGKIVGDVTYDNLKTDASYARNEDGSYSQSSNPTPGAANQN